MKTSIEQILTKKLVGKDLLIHKYKLWGNYVYSSVKVEGCDEYLGSGYAKILNVSLGYELGLIFIMLEETDFLDRNHINVNYSSVLELKKD